MQRASTELNRTETMRALRYSTWDAVYATAFMALTTGSFLTGFALMIGANNFWMGVLSGIPTFAGLAQILSAYFVERRGERKVYTIFFASLGRILWVPILLIPFLLPYVWQLPVFLMLYLFSSIFQNVPTPAWSSWMADLVPPEIRGRYFGRRNMLCGLAVMLLSMPAGWFMDLAQKKHLFSEPIGFASIFGAGCVCALLSILYVFRQAEPPMILSEKESDPGLRGMLAFYKTPFQNKPFVRLMTFGAIFSASQFFAAPFFMVYMLKVLKLDYTWVQIFTVIGSMLTMITMPLWGYLGDKFGNKPIIGISVVGVGLLPILWVFTSYAHPTLSLAIITLINILGGIFWAGVGLGQFNLLIATTPTEAKSVYVGAWSAIVGLTGTIAPIICGILMTTLPGVWHGPFHLNLLNFHIVFILNTVLRFVALASLRPVEDYGSVSARSVLTQLSSSNVGDWMQIRKLQRGQSEGVRRHAAQSLRASRTTLAVDELITALSDPSMHVRAEAAEALGDIADPRAAEALIARLDDPASGIVDEAAGALGRIGDLRAVLPLARLLEYADKPEQMAAARALGRIGNAEAASMLSRALTSTTGEVQEACVRALGETGEPGVAPVLISLLHKAPKSLRMALIRAMGEIGDPSCADSLLTLLETRPDAAMIAQISVSLGMCNVKHAARPLLEALETVESRVAHKQVLNSVGGLIGDGAAFYPLLALEPYARDEAVSRMLGEMIRRERTGKHDGFGARKRGILLERVKDLYEDGHFSEAALQLVRAWSRSDITGVVADTLSWITSTASRRELEPEEFLLAIFAVRSTH